MRNPTQLTKLRSNSARDVLSLLVVVAAAFALIAAVPATAGAGDVAGPQDRTLTEVDESIEPTDGTNVTIIQYNDIQTAMSNNESVGRLVGAINDRRAAADGPTIVVGGGDEVSPSSLSAVSEWRVPVDVLNVLQPDAEVVGNHDLDYGFGPVSNFSEASEFPWLLANVEAEDGSNVPGTQDYTTVERDGVTIGIMGLVDDAIKGKTAVDFDEAGYEVTDWSSTGQDVATTLREEEGADVVVALAHTGIPESKEIANNTDNIDVIVSGDDEVTYEPELTSGTVIVEAGGVASHIGEVNLSVTDDGVGFTDGRLYNLEEGDFSSNESADSVVQAGRSEDLAQVAGTTTAPLDSRFNSNYPDDTGWGRIIGDAFLAETGADVAMTNSGGIRGNFVIDEGEVTYDDVYTSLPFGNTLVTKEMTGAEIVDYLADTASPPTGNFGAQGQLQVAGISYEIVDRPDPEREVTDVYVQGEPIQMDETYEVTVNSFMAGGETLSQYETLNENLKLYGTAVVEYIEQQGTITPPDENRIRRATRTVESTEFELGEETATLEYEVPEPVESINSTSFTILNETSARLGVQQAELDGTTLTLTADRSDLVSLTEASDTVQFYGTYNDSQVDSLRGGYENSRLNGDASVPEAILLERELATVENELADTTDQVEELQSELDSREEEISELESQLSEREDRIEELESQLESANESESASSSDDGGPGFTGGLAAVVIVGLALVAARRQ
jgi:2',3'-cyclic-nucleotide 2'-phosphodiesterase (5'-nucleotidase family)